MHSFFTLCISHRLLEEVHVYGFQFLLAGDRRQDSTVYLSFNFIFSKLCEFLSNI